ncbi:MAG: hypothetical protein HQL56_19380 [Magnetococcales bacterium]|nr:hypothetical protein [Magnetococcales bacterium]
MIVHLLDRLPTSVDRPFALYQHDESLIRHPCYVDVPGIILANSAAWFQDLQLSHIALARTIQPHCPKWWLAPQSRLDLRPWAQESIVKPLFVALALSDWMSRHPEATECLLIGCDADVGRFLREFHPEITVKGESEKSWSLQPLRQMLLRLALFTWRFLRRYRYRPGRARPGRVAVLFEPVGEYAQAHLGYRYYYGDLLDPVPEVSYHAVGWVNDPEGKVVSIFESASPWDLLVALGQQIRSLNVIRRFARQGVDCTIAGRRSTTFWSRYLRSPVFMPAQYFNALLALRAFDKLFRGSACRQVVYPYEEKGVERAAILACRASGLRTLGFTPHPQYDSALCLRDLPGSDCPKPDAYGVCGNAYVDQFVNWCRKDAQRVHVWGTRKFQGETILPKVARAPGEAPVVLLLLSHPNELRLFESWLDAEERLRHGVRYTVRTYKAVGLNAFEAESRSIRGKYPFVSETEGTLVEDLAACDLAFYCATSAGLSAVVHGRLTVHVTLYDCLAINPFFDRFAGEMLSCSSAARFADCLEMLRQADEATLETLHRRQVEAVRELFTPVRTGTILTDLSA